MDIGSRTNRGANDYRPPGSAGYPLPANARTRRERRAHCLGGTRPGTGLWSRVRLHSEEQRGAMGGSRSAMAGRPAGLRDEQLLREHPDRRLGGRCAAGRGGTERGRRRLVDLGEHARALLRHRGPSVERQLRPARALV